MDARLAIPLMLLTMLLVIGHLLRWTFGPGRRGGRRAPAPRLGTGEEFTPVRVVASFVEAELMRLDLLDQGLEAELGRHGGQAAVLVRARDLHRATDLLAGYS